MTSLAFNLSSIPETICEGFSSDERVAKFIAMLDVPDMGRPVEFEGSYWRIHSVAPEREIDGIKFPFSAMGWRGWEE